MLDLLRALSLLLQPSVPLAIPLQLPLKAQSRSDHEVVALVDSHPLRIRYSQFLSLCFPCAVFKMRMKTVEPYSPAILQNDTACENGTV